MKPEEYQLTYLGFNEYLRLPESRVWHWHKRCRHYLNIRLKGTYLMSATKTRPGSGWLCNECRAKTQKAETPTVSNTCSECDGRGTICAPHEDIPHDGGCRCPTCHGSGKENRRRLETS